MNIYLSARNLAKIFTFSVAAFAVLIAFILSSKISEDRAERELNNIYMKSLEELSLYTDNITNSLSKGIYSGTPEQLSDISSILLKNASDAKQVLAQLPLDSSEISNINLFLSQVGNYACSVSKKAKQGEVLTLEEYMKLAALHDYSEKLTTELWTLDKKVQSGMLSISKTENKLSEEDTNSPPSVTEGFSSFEETTDGYPELIYDGPFSDHILEKEPEMLKGLSEISLDVAMKTASSYTGIQQNELVRAEDELGKMPSYCFECEGNYIAVTKAGGYVSYMLKNRYVDKSKITVDDALSTAKAYLLNHDYKNLTTTYYQTLDNICTINFAVQQEGVTAYTDLIKVSVAMDNAEILGLDARGYLVNHKERIFPKELISHTDAQDSLSPLLNVESVKLSVIPTTGLNEVLTYEFLCTSRNKQNILVYINAQTGREEQILIVYKTQGSVLTM